MYYLRLQNLIVIYLTFIQTSSAFWW